MRILGAILLTLGAGVAVGYLLYWFFSAVADFIPLPLKIAIAAAAVGLILLILSIVRERCRSSEEEEKIKEVRR
jgi:membrane protein implicated in regulation of membrane protease activity